MEKTNNETYLEIAEFTKTQGLKGEIRVKTFCDSPRVLERFDNFYLGDGKSRVKARLCEIRKGFAVLSVDGVNTVEDAQKLIGQTLYIDREDYELPDGTWFIRDLIGLRVVDADSGELYGRVEEILQNAPKDVYCVKGESGKQLLFPATPEVLINVDIAGGEISIRPLPGLFD